MSVVGKAAKRYLLISFGFISLALGIIGLLLPLVPTTPFLLIAASCFCKSSQRFYSWLLNNRIFGKVIRDYEEKRAIESKTKWLALIVLWLAIGSSAFLFWHTVFVPIILIVLALAVSWYVLSLRTI